MHLKTIGDNWNLNGAMLWHGHYFCLAFRTQCEWMLDRGLTNVFFKAFRAQMYLYIWRFCLCASTSVFCQIKSLWINWVCLLLNWLSVKSIISSEEFGIKSWIELLKTSIGFILKPEELEKKRWRKEMNKRQKLNEYE